MKGIKAVVVGASGKMGRAVMKGIIQSDDVQLVGACDVFSVGEDAGELVGLKTLGVSVQEDLSKILRQTKADVVIDFSRKDAASKNIPEAINHGVHVVIGTTGFSEDEINQFNELAREKQVGVLLAPNFSLGAVLMMKYAREIAQYYSQAEIIEYHNDKKIDSPSGTAIATAKKMQDNLLTTNLSKEDAEQAVSPCRGGHYHGVQVHSVRLKSMIAHQEVLFAGEGELLTIRHDSFSRDSFIPGVLMAVRKVDTWEGLKIGLETVLEN